MNIAFIYDTVINPLKGGVERVTSVLAKEFIKQGHKVYYLIFIKPESPDNIPEMTFFFPTRKSDTEANALFLTDFIEENRIDFVLFQNTSFYEGKFPFNLWPLKNCRLINVIHNDPARGLEFYWHLRHHRQMDFVKYIIRYVPYMSLGLFRYQSLKKKAINQFRYTLSHSDRTIILSDKFFNNIHKYLRINSTDKILTINNPLTYEIRNQPTEKKNILLFVGRLTGNKQCDYVIRAWNFISNLYPTWKLVIAGEGPMRKYYESLPKFKGRTEFSGHCNPEKLYRESKIFCMASSFEGWPMVLMEAMSNGAVPVAFKTFPSIVDIIDNGENGILVSPYKVREYAMAISKLIQNESMRAQMARNALIKAAHFTPDKIADKWLDLFASLKTRE